MVVGMPSMGSRGWYVASRLPQSQRGYAATSARRIIAPLSKCQWRVEYVAFDAVTIPEMLPSAAVGVADLPVWQPRALLEDTVESRQLAP